MAKQYPRKEKKTHSKSNKKHSPRKDFRRKPSQSSVKNLPKTIVGTLSVNSRGKGFVAHPDFEEDIEIENQYLNTALHRDEVEVGLLPVRPKERARGEVLSIRNRAKMQFVGVIQSSDGLFICDPDDKRMYRDITIPFGKAHGVSGGEKVLVRITHWKNHRDNPIGEVLKVLGMPGEHDVEMRAIVLEKGFDAEFMPAVLREAEKVAEEHKARFAEEAGSRKDMRDTTTFTIDPVDAKDFDDALSIKKLSGTSFEIGIHIADVSHFVEEGSLLDQEAKNRGFSIYLVDRTIPMLPEILSNDLCSLNPGEDKLAFSAIFEVDEKGKVLSRWFGKTVIKSDKRFPYEEAQNVLNAKTGEFYEELNTLNEMAKRIRSERFKKGAIDFDTDEVKFRLDSEGKPIDVVKKERLDTHKLVEEFMLLANREVAEFIFKANKQKQLKGGFIYRVHDLPDSDRVSNLSIFLRALGYELEVQDGKVSSKDLNALLNKIEGKAEESLVKTAAVRTMSKAIYTTKNIGHYGLAFQYYTHFTSPIRRYPDLLVHRFIERELQGKAIENDEFVRYEKIARDMSEKEVKAAEAERDSIKYKQVEYMKERLGEEFEGVISGVTEWGIYVEERTTKSEGMVKIRDLADDYYELDEKSYALVGRRTGKKYTLGDTVKFKIAGADLERKTLDYVFTNT